VCHAMQGLQSTLSDCRAPVSSLDSLSAQLSPVSDAATASQFTVDHDQLSTRHSCTSAKVNANIEQLENIVKSWGDARARLEALAVSVNEAQQLLTSVLPQHQHDMMLQSQQLQVVTVSHSLVYLHV